MTRTQVNQVSLYCTSCVRVVLSTSSCVCCQSQLIYIFAVARNQWIRYVELLDCAFCLSCELFSQSACAAGAAVEVVEAALMSRSLCDGQGLLSLSADDLIALQLPTPTLRLLHSSLDALR
jgi:hypothetical protein